MSQNALEERYGPLIRVPPLLVMDALISGRLTLFRDAIDEHSLLVTLIHLAVLLICGVLFFLPSSTLKLCYALMVTMTALKTSQWWNGIFLQKLGMENITTKDSNQTVLSSFGDGDEGTVNTLDVMSSDEFLLYLCIQLMYSFIFTKTPALLNRSRIMESEAPVLSVWLCLVSPVFLCLFLNTFPVLPPDSATYLIKTFYRLYPILPILLLDVVWSMLYFVHYYLTNVRVIARTYARIYIQFGIQVLVENQWVRLRVPTVLRLFWLTRFGLHVGRLVLQYHYAPTSSPPKEMYVDRTMLSTALSEVATESCSTMIAVLGLSATLSPVANAIGNLARLFLGGERDGGENIGTLASVLFFILALQTGLPDLSPENRLVRLGRNMGLLSTAILHFIHTMLNGTMMQLSTSHVINRGKHARALTIATLLIVLPIWFIVYLWTTNHIGTWMLALTAFCLELVVKVTVTLVVYILFFIDTQGDTFWEQLDDYVYYVKATGSTIEFISGIFLFVNGAWIFVFESRGIIRAFMICIHAYFNIFQLGKDGWKKFKNRRLAVQKITLMEQATAEMLASHNDVCAICYQELNNACVTPCHHLFHAMCLRKWLYVQDSCPLCHKEIMVPEDPDDDDDDDNTRHDEVDENAAQDD
ncbi:E3 ubiquitin-protein ligase RNF139 [Strongylocentrotus purpuratus]|uniref:RING-type domain-containing protein n=1 Tax=Strongylocentrotus purpuratus TaxID=7668 RepID=A0A7M7GIR3_STRPU|nr:E3 ubiquitin-protein ligase RNF139 [Strongylocentrotus purpuratus]